MSHKELQGGRRKGIIHNPPDEHLDLGESGEEVGAVGVSLDVSL